MKKRRKHISLKHIYHKQKKLERLRRKSKNKKKARNIARNAKKKSPFKENHQNGRNNYFSAEKGIVCALSEFSFYDFPDNVISFIDKVEETISKKKYQIIKFDISKVTKIDIGAIGVLLSKINELSKKGIRVEGNFPKDEQCKKLIIESGYLYHMRDLKGRKFNLSQENSNLMIKRGFDRTSNTIVGNAIKKAVEHLTGKEEGFRPLYSIAQEMCANSVEHANKNNKNWLFSVWHKSGDCVCFSMTDIGEGILGTLKRKFAQIIKETISLTDNKKILERAFEKKYSSQTEDINRNKGLPKIKNVAIEKYINNLIVITNNVLLDFSNPEKSKLLNKKFKGTYYYWELNKECIQIWKSRKLA